MKLMCKVFYFTFGVLALLLGTSILLWVLYNECVERQPEFKRPPLVGTFGIAPTLCYIGYLWLKKPFKTPKSG